jgi:hypothetical protein
LLFLTFDDETTNYLKVFVSRKMLLERDTVHLSYCHSKDQYSIKVNIWSMRCILFELATGQNVGVRGRGTTRQLQFKRDYAVTTDGL